MCDKYLSPVTCYGVFLSILKDLFNYFTEGVGKNKIFHVFILEQAGSQLWPHAFLSSY
jgi:hypothetical protein